MFIEVLSVFAYILSGAIIALIAYVIVDVRQKRKINDALFNNNNKSGSIFSAMQGGTD